MPLVSTSCDCKLHGRWRSADVVELELLNTNWLHFVLSSRVIALVIRLGRLVCRYRHEISIHITWCAFFLSIGCWLLLCRRYISAVWFMISSPLGSLGGAMATSKSVDKLKMRRSLMDSYNETVRSAPKVRLEENFCIIMCTVLYILFIRSSSEVELSRLTAMEMP